MYVQLILVGLIISIFQLGTFDDLPTHWPTDWLTMLAGVASSEGQRREGPARESTRVRSWVCVVLYDLQWCNNMPCRLHLKELKTQCEDMFKSLSMAPKVNFIRAWPAEHAKNTVGDCIVFDCIVFHCIVMLGLGWDVLSFVNSFNRN